MILVSSVVMISCMEILLVKKAEFKDDRRRLFYIHMTYIFIDAF